LKWLDQFKIAVVENDSKTVDALLRDIPDFSKIEDMRVAYTLIGEAKKKFEKEQTTMIQKMNKIQKAKKFLNEQKSESKLNEVY
jgi:hypothetical protein